MNSSHRASFPNWLRIGFWQASGIQSARSGEPLLSSAEGQGYRFVSHCTYGRVYRRDWDQGFLLFLAIWAVLLERYVQQAADQDRWFQMSSHCTLGRIESAARLARPAKPSQFRTLRLNHSTLRRLR
jgi:hypothetical protein